MKFQENLPNSAPSSGKSRALTRATAAASATALILGSQGCSTVSGAAAGGAIGGFGGPVTAGIGAAIGASVGQDADRQRNAEKSVRSLFDTVPPSIVKRSATEWKSLAHFANAEDIVTMTPKIRKGNTVTFLVTVRYGKDNTIVGPVELDKTL